MGDLESEIWKDIPGYEGYYQASNLGRIRSLDRIISKNDPRTGKDVQYNRKGKISKLTFHHSQYLVCRISKYGKTKSVAVHRLIAKTFIPNLNNKKIVNHINGIKTDNNVRNLEWVSDSENVKHVIASGLTRICSGENHGSSIYKNEDIIKIRKLYSEGRKQSEIAKEMNIPRERIWEIVHRRTWKHI